MPRSSRRDRRSSISAEEFVLSDDESELDWSWLAKLEPVQRKHRANGTLLTSKETVEEAVRENSKLKAELSEVQSQHHVSEKKGHGEEGTAAREQSVPHGAHHDEGTRSGNREAQKGGAAGGGEARAVDQAKK